MTLDQHFATFCFIRLVVQPYWHIRVETPIALHSVAHRVSHQIPAESEMSRQNRATPPKSSLRVKVSHLSPDTPVALPLIRSRQGASLRGGGCRGGLVEGIAALLGSENGSRYRGVSQLQSHQSRYSVQLRVQHCLRSCFCLL